jgi:hypothetical protein
MGAAKAIPLPLRPTTLADETRRQLFVRASIADQAHAAVPAAPYFSFSTLQDPWLNINLACIRTLVELRGALPVVAFVRCSLAGLANGTLQLAAARYASALPAGSLVFVGVGGLRPDECDSVLLTKYLLAVQAFALAGLAPIADRVGDFGPAAIAFGARGCARGTRIYRHAPPKATFSSEINPKMRLKWLAPGTAQRLPVSRASARQIRGSMSACPESELCVPLRANVENIAIRLHDAHLHRHELLLASVRGAAGVSSDWRGRRLKRLHRWAQAVDDAAALSAEA